MVLGHIIPDFTPRVPLFYQKKHEFIEKNMNFIKKSQFSSFSGSAFWRSGSIPRVKFLVVNCGMAEKCLSELMLKSRPITISQSNPQFLQRMSLCNYNIYRDIGTLNFVPPETWRPGQNGKFDALWRLNTALAAAQAGQSAGGALGVTKNFLPSPFEGRIRFSLGACLRAYHFMFAALRVKLIMGKWLCGLSK